MAITRERLTLAEFLELPDEEPALEYFQGTVTQKVAPKPRHSRLQTKLAEWFNRFAEPEEIAVAFAELRTTFAGSSCVPDVSVYRWARLPVDADGDLLEECLEPPDIAVEIVSPGQSVSGLTDRCRWYVEHGVQIALLIEPRRPRVRDFRPGRPPRTFGIADTIDFHEVIPGFAVRVDELFALLHFRAKHS
jgi:Uma2 family endonuclease